ncbi:hypothetical protein BDL97_05G092600 [Sphagnum fallax]|nr:hypothetical protein BDL97_05G092600 [Sphagnum fallax]
MCLGGIHMVVSMAIYSSSPPTTWHIQNATSSKTAMATKDMDLHTPPHAHHRSSKSLLQGGGGAGLSIMFSTTNNMRRRKYAFSSDDSGSPFATSCVVGFEMRNTDAAREKVLQFVEEFTGLSTSSSSTPSHAAAAVEVCDSKLRLLPPSSATTKLLLLESAQAQHRVFCDPCVVKAYRLAEDSHKGQFRRNGDLYLTHCVETALILATTGAGSAVVAAGLLHDAVDDSNLSPQLLRGAMGDDVADMVLGVSRLSEFSQLARDNKTVCDPLEADRLRTMILSMVDVRVVLIKLADRLHNMRTLGALSFRKQLQIANETLEIFAPLANRLGVWSWKAELEDLCFKHLKPDEHKELATRLFSCCREGIVMSSIHQLDEALRSHGVQFTDLSGRPKNLYSIYKKMTRKGRSIEEIFDVRGLRLILQDEKSCYDALGIVHKLWLHIPGTCKDYILMPKPNGYQSLHTVVRGDDGYPLEVQIRTVAMHHQAEFGLAAHWRYKEDNSKHSAFILERVEWARWVLTWHSEILDTKMRLSPLRADLRPPCPFPTHTSDCPYASVCYGPQLSVIEPLLIIKVENENMVVQELPPGSTVADLVSTRRSDMDSLAVSSRRLSRREPRVKVNHQFINTFQQKLRMGDLVEITMVVVCGDTSQPSPICSTSAKDQPCGKIALEFQREHLKRMYLDGGDCSEETRRPLEKRPSVAGLI